MTGEAEGGNTHEIITLFRFGCKKKRKRKKKCGDQVQNYARVCRQNLARCQPGSGVLVMHDSCGSKMFTFPRVACGKMDIFVCLIYDIIHLLRCRLFSRQQVQRVWAHKCIITLSAYQTVLLDADLWLPHPFKLSKPAERYSHKDTFPTAESKPSAEGRLLF